MSSIWYLTGSHHQSGVSGLIGKIQINSPIHHRLQHRKTTDVHSKMSSGPTVDIDRVDIFLGFQSPVNAVNIVVDHALEQDAAMALLLSGFTFLSEGNKLMRA